MSLSVVILAAGQGTRMRSSLPKVLHEVAGKPLVQHVIDTAEQLGSEKTCVVYGHGGDIVKANVDAKDCVWIHQADQLGTGHAVEQTLSELDDDQSVLILYGDVPLIQENTLRNLIHKRPEGGISLLTVKLSDPTGYGRIVRDDNDQVTAIVEHKDANEELLKINEVNTGIMALGVADLKRWLDGITNNNAQGEYYLTDVIAMASEEGKNIVGIIAPDELEVEGVNNRVQLARIERHYQKLKAEELMLLGVTIADPSRIDIRGDIEIEQDVYIDVGVILKGKVKIGSGTAIGANCILENCELGKNITIKDHTIIEGAVIGKDSSVGPFARIRPGTELEQDVHIGNFVEVKKSKLDVGTKAGHLSYLGDCEIGKNVNVGAGTISCNYDGKNKHKTIIEDNVFVGSDTQLVAPVRVGKDVTIAAGTTVTRDVNNGVLVISRTKQREISNWKRPEKND